MIYQPRNVQPSSNSIDADIDNTFTMEMQTNSYISAYQLSIIDFNNNPVYTGTKEILSEYLYNEDTLSIPVNTNFGLSNGVNYKWRTRLYQPLADMLITYGLIQSESTATNIYLQKNINIRDTMKLTIGSETKTISSYDISTGLAIVSEGFSSAPTIGTQYYIYSDFIETVPDYIFYARKTPSLYIENVPNILTRKYYLFKGVYVQNNGVPIVYHIFNIYILNKDGSRSLVNTSGKIYSANLSYQYNNFRTGNTYYIEMIVENDMGIISQTNLYSFDVSYQIIEYLQQPQALFDSKQNAIKISWSAPIEHDATSFRSDAATGIIQDNSDTFTQATFEHGQSIGEGDVVQVTNSDFDMVLYGKSEQETRSGKNVFNMLDTTNFTFRMKGDSPNYQSYKLKEKGTNYIRVSGGGGNYTEAYIDVSGLKPNTKYSISFTITENTTGYTPSMNLQNNGITDITGKITIGMGLNNAGTPIGTNKYVTFNNIQLEQGSTATNYEPYGVSPSPDFPSEIKNVEGIRNLFDYSTNIIENANLNNHDMKIYSDSTCKLSYLKCEPNTTYTISRRIPMSNRFMVATTETLPTINSTLLSYYASNDEVTTSITITTPANAHYIVIRFIYNVSSNDYETYAKTIQVEEGSIAHDYVPYGSWLKIKDTGKNLLNLPNTTIISNGVTSTIKNNELTIKGICTQNWFKISGNLNLHLKAGTYTYSRTTKDAYRYNLGVILASGTNKTIYGSSEYNTTFTIDEDFIINTLSSDNNIVGTSFDFKDYVQLEQGSTATPYEPYKENTVLTDLNIYDNEGNIIGHHELCSIGDIKDELDVTTGLLTKRIGKVVLDGSDDENWDKPNTNLFNVDGAVPNALYIRYDISLKCTNYIAYMNEDSNGEFLSRLDNVSYACDLGGSKQIRFKDTRYTNLNDFKNSLSNNPVTVYYVLETPEEFTIQSVDTSSLKVDGKNYLTVSTNIDSTFDLVYPYKTITGNTNDYTLFNPAGVSNTGTIKSYNALTGVATLMADKPFTYIPMKGDSYAVISNIYNVSGFSYLYDTPYSPVNSLYTKGYTATWHSEDGLCTLPVDYNITFQFSPDSNFFYDDNGRYREEVIVFDTETDEEGAFQVVINKNKLIFRQDPSLSLESYFYDNVVQVFVLTETGTKQTNEDYIWDDTAIWNDNYIWTEGGTSLERICEHWWKVQITKTGIKIEEVFPG